MDSSTQKCDVLDTPLQPENDPRGQRRTFAVRETGLTTISIVIDPDTEGSGKARAFDRIGKQITANRHRKGLTAAQHTRGVAQMLEFGASITRVSKTLAMNKKDVTAEALERPRQPAPPSTPDSSTSSKPQ
ncbi:hypothetical protein [Rhodococcus sp. D-46]|uniref:hypothetical protein n=1 Tax=Rhodococcus sp. D-46 TaxID=2716265 RepID=UPI001F604A16